ncbi:MAG: DNA replication/repair protein RecF [Thermodesulfobacteriota bacterium]
MQLKSLTLQNFKNYRRETFSFHDRFNLITGENGHGKTNLLEAIHFLSTTRPFKQHKMEDIICFGQTEGRIKGEFDTRSGLSEVHIMLGRGGKTIKLNGKVLYDSRKITGRFNVVTFLPEDTEYVKGSPADRRRYLDILVSNFEPVHPRDLKQYSRAVSQRNAILQKVTKKSDILDLWDGQIAELGGRIMNRRIATIEKLEPLVAGIYNTIAHQKKQIKVEYNSPVSTEGNLEENIREGLQTNLQHDIKRGHTTVGPHRDQPEFILDGRDASKFASQGEAKTLAIALRAAEISLIRSILGRLPIVLLDDISSELDRGRKLFLFKLLSEFQGQIFITALETTDVIYEGQKKTFLIKDGKAKTA